MERKENINSMNAKQFKVWEKALAKYDVVSSEAEIEFDGGLATFEAWNMEDCIVKKDYKLFIVKLNGELI